jgi:Fe-S-cluster-containing hydrogenase component 2
VGSDLSRAHDSHRVDGSEVRPRAIADHPDSCVFCRSCELACSYHHLGVFQPGRASVQMQRDSDTGLIARRRLLEPEDEHLACDECEREDERMCEKYCSRPTVRAVFGARHEAVSPGAVSDGAETPARWADVTDA